MIGQKPMGYCAVVFMENCSYLELFYESNRPHFVRPPARDLQAFLVNQLTSLFLQVYMQTRSGLSQWTDVKRGCPQGSVFGQLFWNMFQNDLAEVVKADISMYADDHQIFSSDCSIDEVAERLQQNGNKMTDWHEENLLKVNIKKYQLMAFGSVKNID